MIAGPNRATFHPPGKRPDEEGALKGDDEGEEAGDGERGVSDPIDRESLWQGHGGRLILEFCGREEDSRAYVP